MHHNFEVVSSTSVLNQHHTELIFIRNDFQFSRFLEKKTEKEIEIWRDFGLQYF